MRKILIGLLFFIGWSVQAQIVPASQVQISQFGRLKKLTVKPATPAVGFGNFYNLNDSLHYEISTKDWNLGKLTYKDTLANYLLRTDTVLLIGTRHDIQAILDSLYQQRYILTSHSGTLATHTGLLSDLQDSIDNLRDTSQLHQIQISGKQDSIPASTASKFYAWDKSWRAVDWSYIANRPGVTSAWQLGSDSTLNALYPVNIASLKTPPDSRVTVGYMPIHDALNGDTLDYNFMIGGRRFQFYSVADGAGSSSTGGINIIGKINGSYSALWDSAYVNRATHFYEGLRKTGINVRTYAPEIEHDSLKGYKAWKHFPQSAIDTVHTTLSGLLKATAGVLSVRPDSTVQYNQAYLQRVNAWTLPLRLTTGTASIDSATTIAPGAMSAWDKTKLAGIAVQANKYVHPNHSGAVTSVADGATTITDKAVTLAKMNDMATSSLIYRRDAGTGVPQVNTLGQLKTDLLLSNTNTGDNAANSLYAGSIGLWRLGADSTLNGLYPANIASLRMPTDSRVTIANMGLFNSVYGDTVDINMVIGGRRYQFFNVADGTGSSVTGGINITGTGYFAGNLKLGSTITIGGHTYTYPSSLGTANQVLTITSDSTLGWSDKVGGVPGFINSLNGSSASTQTIVGSPWDFANTGDSLRVHTLTIPAATNAINGYATSAHITAIEANTAKVSFPGFGTTHTTAAYGDDARFTDARVSNITPGTSGNLMISNGSVWTSAAVPTWNQTTTGTAAGLTAQYIDWNASTGGNSIANKPSSMTPASHTHGNITNAGLIGTTANLPVITGTGGIIQAGSFGTGANTFAAGNDSRFHGVNDPNSLYAGLLNRFYVGPDSTLSALMPLNIAAFRYAPDTKYVDNIPIVSAAYADRVSKSIIIGGTNIFEAYADADGAGSFYQSGVNITGKGYFSQGLNIAASQTYKISDTTLLKGATLAGTTPALYTLDDTYGVTRKALAAYVIANATTTPQIQADWTQNNNTLLDYIKNKPTIPAAQVQTDWNATTGLGVLLNKPTIPSITGLVTTSQSTPQTIGSTGSRLVKLWADDLTVTNGINITGSISANGLMVGSGASATGLIYGNKASGSGNLLSLSYAGTEKISINYQGNVLAAGTVLGSNLSGTNTGDGAINSLYSPLLAVQAPNVVYAGPTPNGGLPTFRLLAVADIPSGLPYAATNQTMYIGTTGVTINRASGALTLAGITLTTPFLGTPIAGDFSTGTFTWPKIPTSGTADALAAQYIDWTAASGATSIKNKPTIANQTVQSLSGTTITWNTTNGVNGILTVTGATTITMSNLAYGSTGNLTIQSSSVQQIYFYGYTFKLNPGIYFSNSIVLTSGGSKIDVYSWYYDGVTVFINGTMDYK